jgi:hypothetical protein
MIEDWEILRRDWHFVASVLDRQCTQRAKFRSSQALGFEHGTFEASGAA